VVTYEIDGADFSNLDEFYDEISRVLVPGVSWGRNLDAFNDILRGGFGTPEDGFTLHWKSHELSKHRLPEYETVLEIVRTHGPEGPESNDKVRLVLD
jgi:RNAse (barnase) inhibitor barstar